jgi:hypothetical protein
MDSERFEKFSLKILEESDQPHSGEKRPPVFWRVYK